MLSNSRSAAGACASRPRPESTAEDLLTCTYFLIEGTSAGGSVNPAESATLEPDVFYTAMFAVSPKIQRSCQPLIQDLEDRGPEPLSTGVRYLQDLEDRGPEPLLWLSHYTFQERDWRERDRELTSVENVREHRGCGPREWTRGGGTQCTQRTGETVSGLKTTAGDESGHKGRASCCTPSAELRPDKNLSGDCLP
ncbi:hypothetical protein DPMN_000192 [Dreissena polymorpha]|uniref:Uncharacterized protein n=1 Tax=Dreissena polymorpha TaxID=45954 RepID=A0A9D4MEX9_DREPO|nr:hypothetical protein DPMN_000192 [Dreissena polymorpha]